MSLGALVDALANQSWLTVAAALASILGLLYGLREARARQALEKRLDEGLCSALNRLRLIIGDSQTVRELESQIQHPSRHFLWTSHQAASSLYRSLLEQWLVRQPKVTFKDLDRLVSLGVVSWQWDHQQWIDLICNRPENAGDYPQKRTLPARNQRALDELQPPATS